MIKTKYHLFYAEERNILILELINREFINETDTQIFYYDKLFEELLEDNSYKNLIQIVYYIVLRVVNRNFKDEDGNFIENNLVILKMQ